MAIAVPINQVIGPRRASTFGTTSLTSSDKDRVEFYSGIIAINHRGGDTMNRQKYKSFLPIDPTMTVQAYEAGAQMDTTVLVVPNSVAGDDDEANVAAVDSADIDIEPQGVGGNPPQFLVLSFGAAALNTTLHSVSYHVTVIRRLREGTKQADGDRVQFPEDQAPDV